MELICENIKEDMHKIEEDSKKFYCYAILDLILHSFNYFIDCIKFCFKINYYNNIYLMKQFSNLKSYELIDIYQIYTKTKWKKYNVLKNHLNLFIKIFKSYKFKVVIYYIL